MSPAVTIVSACDRHFLWGAYLLAASAARNLPGIPVRILQTGFDDEDRALLEQFSGVTLHALTGGESRSVASRKSEALLSADTEFVAWLDADCFVVGDIASLLLPENGVFQIRLREPWENAWVWRNHYAEGEERGGIPRSVLDQWREDVGQRAEPAHDTTCVTNAFVLHRDHLGIIRQWQSQIAKVLPARDAGVVDDSVPAYFMTDESVFSSLLVFSELAPPISPLRLDKDPAAHVAHFGARPKPWVRWRKQFWYCHRHVLGLVDWLRENRYATPELPWGFHRRNTLPAWAAATVEECLIQSRAWLGRKVRRG